MPEISRKLPSWLERIFAFVIAQSELNRFSDHLRLKMLCGGSIEEIESKALDKLECDMGPFPSQDRPDAYDTPDEAASMELTMRQMRDDIADSIKEAEAYSWGLAIAGIYHLWERETKNIVKYFDKNVNRSNLKRADFNDLCKRLKSLGYDIYSSSSYHNLVTTNQIANSIKHGDGDSRRKLQANYPNLLVSYRGGEYLGVGVAEFDSAVEAIKNVWSEHENLVTAARNSN